MRRSPAGAALRRNPLATSLRQARVASGTSIISVKTALVSLPLEEPFATPLGTIKAVACLLIEVATEGGLEGFGHLIWYNPRNTTQIKSVRVLVDDLGQALMGK